MQQDQKENINNLNSLLNNLKDEVFDYKDIVSIQNIINSLYSTDQHCTQPINFKDILERIINHITNFQSQNNNDQKSTELSSRMQSLIEFVYWVESLKEKGLDAQISEECYKKFFSFWVKNKNNLFTQNTAHYPLNKSAYPNISRDILIYSREILIGKDKNLNLTDLVNYYLEKIIYIDRLNLSCNIEIFTIKQDFDVNSLDSIRQSINGTREKLTTKQSKNLLSNLIKELNSTQIFSLKLRHDISAQINKCNSKILSSQVLRILPTKPFKDLDFMQYVIYDDLENPILIFSEIFIKKNESQKANTLSVKECNKDNFDETLLNEQKNFLTQKIESREKLKNAKDTKGTNILTNMLCIVKSELKKIEEKKEAKAQKEREELERERQAKRDQEEAQEQAKRDQEAQARKDQEEEEAQKRKDDEEHEKTIQELKSIQEKKLKGTLDQDYKKSLIEEERRNLTSLKENHLKGKTSESPDEVIEKNPQSNPGCYDNPAFIDDYGKEVSCKAQKDRVKNKGYGTFTTKEVTASSEVVLSASCNERRKPSKH